MSEKLVYFRKNAIEWERANYQERLFNMMLLVCILRSVSLCSFPTLALDKLTNVLYRLAFI